MLPNATLFHFGILSSTMHNAFRRTVAGRLECRYRYSNTVVYNNFPFPESCRMPSENDRPDPLRAAVEAAAQAVLDARGQYRREAREAGLPEPTLAELYAPDAGYTALDKAHAALDKAVDKAYGYKTGKNTDDEAERVAFLFELYRKATAA